MQKVSAVLVCLNIENEIDRCLASVAWCDEIVVVDSFSSDSTLDKARRHTDIVHQHTYQGYSRQLELAVGYATGDWIFVIDGDEVCSRELAGQCAKLATAPPPGSGEPTSYEVSRNVWAYGKRIHHGGYCPEYVLRFFRRERAVFAHREVHGAVGGDGPVGRLEGWLDHYTWTDIFRHMQRINTYTSLEVANMRKEQPRARAAGTWAIGARILFSPLGHFLRRFVRHQGWRDGFHGFALAWLDAVHTGLLYFKLWEYRMRETVGDGHLPPVGHAEIEDARRRY